MKRLKRILWLLRPDTEIRRYCISTAGDSAGPLHGWMANSWPNKDALSGFTGIHTSRNGAIDRAILSEETWTR